MFNNRRPCPKTSKYMFFINIFGKKVINAAKIKIWGKKEKTEKNVINTKNVTNMALFSKKTAWENCEL